MEASSVPRRRSRLPRSRRRRTLAPRQFRGTRSPSRDGRSRGMSRFPAAATDRRTTRRARARPHSQMRPTRGARARRFPTRRFRAHPFRARRATRRLRTCRARGTVRRLPMRAIRPMLAPRRRSPAAVRSVRATRLRRAGRRVTATRDGRPLRRRQRLLARPQIQLRARAAQWPTCRGRRLPIRRPLRRRIRLVRERRLLRLRLRLPAAGLC